MTVSRTKTRPMAFSGERAFRRLVLGTTGLLALCLASHHAFAQDVEQVQVTGTRIMQDGYSAPTPVTVIGAAQIDAEAPANLADFVNKLPAVIGSTTPNNSQGSISAGTAGLNALNLRGLGTNRTLVLVDGHRSAPSAATGQVDINTIPQELVSRVDVVTGGASADYGSDAVGGVVNFILDKHFTGLKANLEYGETTYGENANYRGVLTYGTDFDGDRGHILLSGEVYTAEGIPNTPRTYNTNGYFKIQNPAYNATANPSVPYYLITPNAYPSQTTPGGIVVSGPLQGTYFGSGASVNKLNYGAISGPWMVGGDGQVTSANYYSGLSLASSELRQNVFGRASYNITPDIEVYAQASYSKWHGKSYYLYDWANVGGVTIQKDNAFLPASFATQMTTAGVSSVNIGTTNQGMPRPGTNNSRGAERFQAGADGKFDLFGKSYTWDAYGQVGITDTNEQTLGNWNAASMAYAQDAVVTTAANVGASGSAIGSIQCRAVLQGVAAAAGCRPLSRIGINGGLQTASAYQAGVGYVEGAVQPYRHEYLEENSAGFNVSGSPFDDWAGPVSIAFGGEWRKESVNGYVPNAFRSGWLYGNYLPNVGHYNVAEGYIETAVPIMTGLDFNGSIRYTNYSTSGGVNTWKVGANYQPVDDVKFRVTYSHDIRAPNLSELFAAGIARANTVLVNNASFAFNQNQTGNSALAPEAANSLGAGVVMTPRWIPGLTASVDYFNINVKHEIGTITAQNIADLCFQSNVQSYCDAVHGTYAGAPSAATLTSISTIDLKPFNFTAQKEEGIDFEITYQVPLEEITLFGAIPGDLTLHGLATNYLKDYTNDGINPPTDVAGVNTSVGLPSWSYRVEATYHTDPWTFDLIGHGVSAGAYMNEYVTCTTGCPVSTIANRTINYNRISGQYLMDATVSYDFTTFGGDTEAFFAVKNVFNTSPALVGNGPDGLNTPAYPQTNSTLYDPIGRTFRTGLRFKF